MPTIIDNALMAPGGMTQIPVKPVSPVPYVAPAKTIPAPIVKSNPNGLTDAQVKAGYSTIAGPYDPVTGQLRNQSLTTLSSDKSADIAANSLALQKLADKGVRTDSEGNPRNADGSYYNADEGTTKMVSADTSPEDNATQDLLNSMKASLDASTNGMIANIQQKFDQRRAETREITRVQGKALNNALLMGGATGQGSSAQYAPISSTGIITANENYGIKQIAALDSEEQDLIAQAKAAQQSGNFAIMEKQLVLAERKRQEKLDAAAALNKTIAEQNNKIREQNIQSSRDSAIADLYAQGVTDTAQLLNYLNYDNKGKKVGDFTADEISKTLGTIAKNNRTDPTTLKNDTDEFFYFKNQPNGLPASILNLPTQSEQLAAYLKMKQGAITAGKTKISSGSGGNLTTASGQSVTSTKVGSATDASIDNDVKAVLEGRNTLYNIRQTMGRTNSAAAYMQRMRDAITKVDPSFDFIASDAGGKAVSTSYFQRAISAINAVMPNIESIVNLSNQVPRLGVKGVDNLLQSGAAQFGNQKVSNFKQAQKLIADEIGVALGAGTVSDMKLQLGFDVTDPSVSPEVFASNMEIVKEFIQNRKDALNKLRYASPVISATAHNEVALPGDQNVADTTIYYNSFNLPH